MADITIYGNMKWFRVAEQPSGFDQLPDEFAEMKDLWLADKDANFKTILDTLSPYVGARLVADNLYGWRDFFSDESYGEFEAIKINVVGIDFSTEPLPLCKAEAWFKIPLSDGVSKDEVVQWNDDVLCGELYGALVFYWDFPESEELEEMDLTVGDHSGAEAQIE